MSFRLLVDAGVGAYNGQLHIDRHFFQLGFFFSYFFSFSRFNKYF